jgi:alpha-1,2-mannosyltransferase
MNRMAQAIRSGDWVTANRIQVYSMIVLALGIVMLSWLVATGDGIVDYQRRPLGTDFSNVYAAGKWVLAGRPEAPFDPVLQHEMEKRVFGADTPFYGWHYPPVFLGLAALFALMPYGLSLFTWQAVTLTLYLAMMRAIVPRPEAWLPAIAFPAVFINFAHGQNGLATAALFGGALLLLDRRPVIAGILIGLLCYKPQFGVLIPIVLIASGRWQAFAVAAATVAAVCALTWLAFGTSTWLAFRDSLEFTRTAVLEQGGTGFHKIQSPFAAMRLWGAPVEVAYAVQAATGVTVAVLLAILWRSRAAFELQAAALLTGALLATPYVLDYDLTLMAPAMAFFAVHAFAREFHSYEKSALVFCWFAPLIARGIGEYVGMPIGLIALALLFGLALRRASADGGRKGALSAGIRLR